MKAEASPMNSVSFSLSDMSIQEGPRSRSYLSLGIIALLSGLYAW
jgi:hypothetical protein